MANKTPAILLLVFAAAAGGFFWWNTSQRSGQSQIAAEAIVIMKNAAFEPAELTIEKGTKVIFKNQDNSPRWPASNLHPTHGIYPEFDPREPVALGAEWSFVFDKAGSWKFHDHLLPGTRGSITVKE